MGALSALAAEGGRPRKRDGSDRRTRGDVQMTSENVFDLLLRSLLSASG